MPHARPLPLLALTLATGALACSSSDKCIPLPVEIPVVYQPAIVLGVADSVTGAPLADSANGTVSSAAVSDSLRHGWYQPDSILVSLVGAGWYTVTVQRPGYLTWVRNDVIVKTNACGATISTDLTARLQRAP